jgi:hypothetical protein
MAVWQMRPECFKGPGYYEINGRPTKVDRNGVFRGRGDDTVAVLVQPNLLTYIWATLTSRSSS